MAAMSTTFARGAWLCLRVCSSTTTRLDLYVLQRRFQPNPMLWLICLRLDHATTSGFNCDFVRCVQLIHHQILDQSPNPTSPRLLD